MKKYNTPELSVMAVASADVITASPFTVEATGKGDFWYWGAKSGSLDMQDGLGD